MLKFKIVGKGDLHLSENDFVAKGGEGSIYGKGNNVYKIFESYDHMPSVDKLKELQTLNHQYIISPIEIITSLQGIPIGYSMRWIKDSETLCKLFTTSFRNKEGITEDIIDNLINNMMKTIVYVHEKKFTIVDGNEFNYMVNKKNYTDPFFIDVNCWQTPSFQADAILPTVRDYSSNKFTDLTDWFAFAVITFQLFTGIHPFKGKYTKDERMDTITRMKNGISVFDPNVRVPASVRDFSLIPPNYMKWFKQLFIEGKRMAPPNAICKAVISLTKVAELISSNDSFDISMIQDVGGEILFFKYVNYGNVRIVKTKNTIWIGPNQTSYSDFEVLIVDNEPVLVKSDGEKLVIKSITGSTINEIDLDCQEIMIVENVLFIMNRGNITEIDFMKVNGSKIQPSVRTTWSVMPNSTQSFSNIYVQSINGNIFLSIPVPVKGKKTKFIITSVEELNGCKIINAKHLDTVCIFSVFKDNQYQKCVVRFDDEHVEYDVRWINDCDDSTINFVVLPNGIVAHIPHDGEFEVFSKFWYQQNKVKQIKNDSISMDMTLVNDGMKVMFTKKGKIYSISVK